MALATVIATRTNRRPSAGPAGACDTMREHDIRLPTGARTFTSGTPGRPDSKPPSPAPSVGDEASEGGHPNN
jgi:hypothetical protein